MAENESGNNIGITDFVSIHTIFGGSLIGFGLINPITASFVLPVLPSDGLELLNQGNNDDECGCHICPASTQGCPNQEAAGV